MRFKAVDVANRFTGSGFSARLERNTVRIKTSRIDLWATLGIAGCGIAALSIISAVILIPIILVANLSWYWLGGTICTIVLLVVFSVSWVELRQAFGYTDIILDLEHEQFRLGSWSVPFKDIRSVRALDGHGGPYLEFSRGDNSTKSQAFRSDGDVSKLASQLAEVLGCEDLT